MTSEAIVLWTETSSDPELIAGVRAGDSAAFGVLYERHVGAARKVAAQYTNAVSDIDDVVSESFSRVLRALQRGDGPDLAFRAYLFTIVRRTGMDIINKAIRTKPRDDMSPYESAIGYEASSDEPVLDGFEHGMVADAFKSLPERWQAVLWYTEVEKKNPKEIAPLLGLSANGVAALAYRAREALRQAYLQQHLNSSQSAECLEANSQLGAFVRGGLSKRENAKVDAHVRACERCTALVAELADVNRGMRGIIAPLFMGVLGVGALDGGLPIGGVLGPHGAGAGGAGAGAGGSGGAATGGVAGVGGSGVTGAAGIVGVAGATGVAAKSSGAAAGITGLFGAASHVALPAAAVIAVTALAIGGASVLGLFTPETEGRIAGGAQPADSVEAPLAPGERAPSDNEIHEPAPLVPTDNTADAPAEDGAPLEGDGSHPGQAVGDGASGTGASPTSPGGTPVALPGSRPGTDGVMNVPGTSPAEPGGETARPGQVEAPPGPAAPGGSTQPGDSNAPGNSEGPGDVTGPDEAVTPGDTTPPGNTDVPGDTVTPGGSDEPGGSDSPGNNDGPGDISQPGDGNGGGGGDANEESPTPGDPSTPGRGDSEPGDGDSSENPNHPSNPGPGDEGPDAGPLPRPPAAAFSIGKSALDYLEISRSAPQVSMTVKNTGDAVATDVTARITLPAGLEVAAPGSGGAGMALMSADRISAHLAYAADGSFSAGEWECDAGQSASVATCLISQIGSGQSAALTLPVRIASDELPGNAQTTFAVFADQVTDSYTVQTALAERGGGTNPLDPGYVNTGGEAVAHFGGTVMGCAPNPELWTACYTAMTNTTTDSGQMLSNNDRNMVELKHDPNGSNQGLTHITLPEGATVERALLEWSANRFVDPRHPHDGRVTDGWTSDLETVRVKLDSGDFATITADEVDDQTVEENRQYYLARADVTELMADLTSATMTVADVAVASSRLEQAVHTYYGGFTLTIVYATPDVHEDTRVALFEGPHWVKGSAPVTISFRADAGSRLTPSWTAYEGDRGNKGDRVRLGGDNFVPLALRADGTIQRRDSGDAADSWANGSPWTNTLGIDANSFDSKLLGHTGQHSVVASTDGDNYMIGTLAVTIEPPATTN